MGKGKRKQLARKQGAASRRDEAQHATDLFARAKSHDFSSRTTHNKFDIKDNKRAQHVVLGRKVKGRSRDVSRARTLRQTELEKTLLPAMNRAGKANTFLDRRIGEQDETMNQEERDLQRFIRAQKERFRGSGSGKKGSKFNLEGGDDDVGEDTLTHGGKSVNELDFGRHLREDGYGSDEDMLGDEIVDQLHFAGRCARGQHAWWQYRTQRPQEDPGGNLPRADCQKQGVQGGAPAAKARGHGGAGPPRRRNGRADKAAVVQTKKSKRTKWRR